MRIQLSLLVALSCIVASAVRSDEATGTTGQFQYRVSQIDVSPYPGARANTAIQATLGFTIRNTGKFPVKIAVVPTWPMVQLEGSATSFAIRGGAIHGLSYYGSNATAQCALAAVDFTLLRPDQSLEASMILDTNLQGADLPATKRARFSASLMVQSLEDKKCWIEPFTVSKVPVVVNGI